MVGIDDNPKALDLAKKYVKYKKLKLIEGDVLNMPFSNNSFDKIICSEVLEHLPDDVLGLSEFKRILKPGGKISITVPSHNYPFLWDPINWLLEKIFNTHFKDGFWAGVWNQHIRLYTPESLYTAVEKAGLKVEKIKVLTHHGLPFNHYLLNIGYNIRKSTFVPKTVTSSLNKFSDNPSDYKDVYHKILEFVNRLDKKNNSAFSLQTPTVGISLLATK